ncbi:MAG: hypothetical protein IPJ65_26930 [Archangiaceae bacterium]|nr:hypothetical protein [Archangiaceae bacterium]
MGELAPTDWFAIATGVGITGAYGMVIDVWPFSSRIGQSTHENYGVAVPLRLTFTLGTPVPAGAARNRFYVAIDALAGRTFAGNFWGAQGTPRLELVGGLSFGYQRM